MISYALLLAGAYLAATISGAAGFGGALLLLPLLTHTVGITEAVPLLTIAQFIGNLSRAALGWSQIKWRPAGLFLLGALPLAALGAMSFTAMPKTLIVRAVGGAIIFFVALRVTGLLQLKAGNLLLIGGGAAVGFLSGLVGSAGPLGAAIFLSLGMPPTSYVASEAVTALAMHAVKGAVYQSMFRFDAAFWLLAAAMGAAMTLGSFTAKRLIAKLSTKGFEQAVSVLLCIVALQMIVTG